MSKRLLATALLAMVAVAACAAGPAPSGLSGPSDPGVPSAFPTTPGSADPPASHTPSSPSPPAPSSTPSVSPTPPASTPVPTRKPSVGPLTVEETYLIAGARADLFDCVPLRDGLPAATYGAIECLADDPAVARVGLFMFDGDIDMMAAYFARMDAEGVKRDSGSCEEGEGEHVYIPGGDEVQHRHGCFINEGGYANYRATLPIDHVYIGVLGRTADARALQEFAWRGNPAVPGRPTVWSEPGDGY